MHDKSLIIVDSQPPKKPRNSKYAPIAFEEYKALGPSRTLAKLAVHLRQTNGLKSVSERTLEDWSSAFGWQAAIQQYEKELAEERRRKREAELDKMNDNHAIVAQASIGRAMKHLEKLFKDGDVSAKDAIEYLKLALNTERLARGAATESVQTHLQFTGKEGEPPVQTQNQHLIGFYPVMLPAKDEAP